MIQTCGTHCCNALCACCNQHAGTWSHITISTQLHALSFNAQRTRELGQQQHKQHTQHTTTKQTSDLGNWVKTKQGQHQHNQDTSTTPQMNHDNTQCNTIIIWFSQRADRWLWFSIPTTCINTSLTTLHMKQRHTQSQTHKGHTTYVCGTLTTRQHWCNACDICEQTCCHAMMSHYCNTMY